MHPIFDPKPVYTAYTRGVRAGMLYGCVMTVMACMLVASVTYAAGLWQPCQEATPAAVLPAKPMLLVLAP